MGGRARMTENLSDQRLSEPQNAENRSSQNFGKSEHLGILGTKKQNL